MDDAAAGSTSYHGLPIEQFRIVDNFRDPFFFKWVSRGQGAQPWFGRPSEKDSHRKWVGSDAASGLPFENSCYFQLEFLIARGLSPGDQFMDIGCGCLRGGRHFIDYLDAGRYYGVDISAEVVYRGVRLELGVEKFVQKKPEFVVSNCFDFSSFDRPPAYVFAGSLFTHLPMEDIQCCFQRLGVLTRGAHVEFFATFSESPGRSEHPVVNHYLGGNIPITFCRDEMFEAASVCGWNAEYLGAWGHPKNELQGTYREQMMFRFHK